MANTVLTPIEGRAVIDLRFPSGSMFIDTAPISHIKSVISRSINGWSTATHLVQVSDVKYLDTVLIPHFNEAAIQTSSSKKSNTKNPLVEYRVGISAANNQQFSTRWPNDKNGLYEQHQLYWYNARMQPTSESPPLMVIKTVDNLYELVKDTRIRYYKGSVSSILAEIWRDSEVEPTDSAEKQLYQAHTSSFDFIKDVLIPRARNKARVSDYRFYLRNRKLHFHSPLYCQTIYGIKEAPYTVSFVSAKDLDVSDQGSEFANFGAGNVTHLTYDPMLGVPKPVQASDKSVARFGTTTPFVKNLIYTDGHVGPNLLDDEDAITQYKHASAAGNNFKATFTMTNVLDIDIGDVVSLSVTSKNIKSAYAGLYTVTELHDTISQGVLTTRVTLNRGNYSPK